MSFTLRPFASAALLLSMAGLCAGTLLAAEQTEPSEASAVRARPLVLGVVETAEPSFDDNTVRPVLKAMQSAAPGTQIDVVRLSSATFEVAVAQLKPDLVISPAADFCGSSTASAHIRSARAKPNTPSTRRNLRAVQSSLSPHARTFKNSQICGANISPRRCLPRSTACLPYAWNWLSGDLTAANSSAPSVIWATACPT